MSRQVRRRARVRARALRRRRQTEAILAGIAAVLANEKRSGLGPPDCIPVHPEAYRRIQEYIDTIEAELALEIGPHLARAAVGREP